MSKKVKILSDVDVPIGRGFIAFKKGWTGTVKDEVFDALIKAGKGVDAAPAKREPKKDKDGVRASSREG